MTEYVFRKKILTDGDTFEIPDNARDIDYQHMDDGVTILCYMERQGQSVL